jgi:DNA-binding MarR family transcriptional regulator
MSTTDNLVSAGMDVLAAGTAARRSALDACLAWSDAHARLTSRLDEELGNWHGLSFADFRLLHRLANSGATQARSLRHLSGTLGLTPSALLRQILPLEKTGLVARSTRSAAGGAATAAGPTASEVSLRPAGRVVLQAATDTAAEVCNQSRVARPGEQASAWDRNDRTHQM